MYVVRFKGAFGFIKPWTAVRDSETFSQQFLTPSIVEGMEKKLFPELLNTRGLAGKIIRHRISYSSLSSQQEHTQPRSMSIKSSKIKGQQDRMSVTVSRPRAILVRGVMVNPVLWLAFSSEEYARRAFQQHICLCRNEDIVLPDLMLNVEEPEFDQPWMEGRNNFDGYELIFSKLGSSFPVGFNRYVNAEPMYGSIYMVGNPVSGVSI